jgi:hypothetical protein
VLGSCPGRHLRRQAEGLRLPAEVPTRPTSSRMVQHEISEELPTFQWPGPTESSDLWSGGLIGRHGDEASSESNTFLEDLDVDQKTRCPASRQGRDDRTPRQFGLVFRDRGDDRISLDLPSVRLAPMGEARVEDHRKRRRSGAIIQGGISGRRKRRTLAALEEVLERHKLSPLYGGSVGALAPSQDGALFYSEPGEGDL